MSGSLRSIKNWVVLLLAGLLLTAPVQAQELPRIFPAPTPTDSATRSLDLRGKQQLANPSVVGMGPSKGIILHYERTAPFSVDASSQVSGVRDYQTRAYRNGRLIFKGYIPAWNRPHLKVILGLNYDREEFKFQQQPTSYGLFDNIENKGLKSTGVQLAVIRPVDAVHWYLARVKGELSGDYNSGQDLQNGVNYLRASAEAFYGWKRSPRFSWGVGFQYGYTFGRLSLYPAIIYNRTFEGDRWGIEALFPARVSVRYTASEHSLFYGGYSVDGSNYIVALRQELPLGPDKQPLRSLELRETEVKLRLRWERELLPFLWLGAEGGFRYNYAFDAFDHTNASRERIVRTKLGGTPYVSLELFAVPPRKLLEKAGVRR